MIDPTSRLKKKMIKMVSTMARIQSTMKTHEKVFVPSMDTDWNSGLESIAAKASLVVAMLRSTGL